MLLAASTTGVLAAVPKNAILLSEVQSLTLRAGKSTTHRRVPAIPQLQCVGSSKRVCALANSLQAVDTMRCVNQGTGDQGREDVQWACTASLPSTLRLGSTDVVCEGYASADDPYILKGSCGVEYRVVLTEEGERRYPELAGGGGGLGSETDWGGYVFGLLFFGVLAWIVWSACVQRAENGRAAAARPQRRRGGGGGGGGGGGWWPGGGGPGAGPGTGPFDDPPPPYPGTKGDEQQQGWRPGFWSGLAGGAAAGYMAGNRGRQPNNNYGAGAGWGGDSGGSYGSTWDSGSRRGGSGSSSGSQTQRESTGFGSTSRR